MAHQRPIIALCLAREALRYSHHYYGGRKRTGTHPSPCRTREEGDEGAFGLTAILAAASLMIERV
jgi:hypothetical protein